MKKLVVLAAVAWVAMAGMAWAGETSALAKLHGGNILQSLNNAAMKREIKASFDTAKIEVINDVAVITGAATDKVGFVITLHKDTARVRTVVLFVKPWMKDDAENAVFSIMAINNFMGRLIHPGMTDDALTKMYLTLVGGKMEGLDGKVRKARLDGVLLTSGFEPALGFVISATEDDKKQTK